MLLASVAAGAALAQSRGDVTAPGAGSPQTGPGRDVPNLPRGGGTTFPSLDLPKNPGQPDGPARPGGGGPTDGLPDAVTVLNILRGLPHWIPGGDTSEGGTYGPPDSGPKPKGGATPSTDNGASKPPNRVVTINPGAPFTPRPAPRGDGTPPAVIGAIVPEVRAREVLVTLGPGSDAATVTAISTDLGLDGETLYTSNLLGTRVVRFQIPDTRSIGEVTQQLAGDSRVQVAQPNYVFTANQGAAKPVALPIPQYAPQKLHLDQAHRIAQGKQIKIAIIDTAIDTTHPAFANSILATFDALGETKSEPERHGTAIAAIVGARAELTGVAPAANILGVRAFATDAGGKAVSNTLALLKALDWAAINSARVINMSFAGPNDPLLGQAIAAAVKRGIVVVAAAGNGGPSAAPAYPGAYPSVIAVTAIDSVDAIYKNANRGTYIALAAPGVDIIAAAPKGAYDISSGTSMAAAHVSGIAALMLEKNPKLTPKEIRDMLSKSARRMDRMDAADIGAGIADAVEALSAVK